MTAYRNTILQSTGYFGEYGGAYVPEAIRANTDALAAAFEQLQTDPAFLAELKQAYVEISGRPTAFTPLRNLSHKLGGAQLYIKNEGLNHTGAHKINHVLGQIIVARHMGRRRIIAETGAGQHGLATASLCARYGMPCTIYMGYKDYLRQRPNVFYMQMMGAEVVPVEEGQQTLNDAVVAAMKDLLSHPEDTHYLIGTVIGPNPYPKMNTFFQKIIGEEVREQALQAFGRLPHYVIACVGGGSNAMGAFFDFLDEPDVQLIGVEAGGHGEGYGAHAARFRRLQKGIYEGYYSYILQDADGNIAPTSSISAGLDYCGVSPILAWLYDAGRVQFRAATDEQVRQAYRTILSHEGVVPALESLHAVAYALELAPSLPPEQHIVINASGRGEKDLFIAMENLQPQQLAEFMELKLQQLRNLAISPKV
ncbi:MAG: tryptophan synthase subunit beta [Bacteroidetes bacterium]|jgi:tryptophan synthase beta chain|nr:tryptophan synthase subunit beta [Bacteroidota bacterium]